MSPRAAGGISPQVFQIMLSLAGGEMHGYALMQDIEERTGGAMRLTASTLYGAVKRMLESGWIEELEQAGEDAARRRVYRLTRQGRAAARAEAARLAEITESARARNLLPRRS